MRYVGDQQLVRNLLEYYGPSRAAHHARRLARQHAKWDIPVGEKRFRRAAAILDKRR